MSHGSRRILACNPSLDHFMPLHTARSSIPVICNLNGLYVAAALATLLVMLGVMRGLTQVAPKLAWYMHTLAP